MILLHVTLLFSIFTSSLVAAGGDYGPDTCLEGYVWREATRDDHVCVAPAKRDLAASQNADQATRHNPDGTCKSPFVYREATPSDKACVSESQRLFARWDNRDGPKHRASLNVWFGPTYWVWRDTDIYSYFLQLEGDHFNLGSNNIEVWVMRPKSDNGKLVKLTTVSGTAMDGKVAGSILVKTGIDDFRKDGVKNDSYFQVKDLITGRWSEKLWFRSG